MELGGNSMITFANGDHVHPHYHLPLAPYPFPKATALAVGQIRYSISLNRKGIFKEIMVGLVRNKG